MLLFHCLLPVIATDRAHHTPYTYAVLLLPARNPTNSSICFRIANRRVPLCDPHLHFARFARDIYAISPQSPYAPAFAAELPFDARPDSFGSLYSRKLCRGAHFIMFSFHVEHTSCHSPKPQRLSRFLLVYAYLYIASLRVFRLCVCFFRPCDPFSVVAPRLTIAPRRRSLTPGSASRRVARVPSHRFAFAFRFSAVVLPLFDFSISFCLMLHGAPQTFCLFFLCLRLFALSLRGSAPHLRPSLIRLRLKRSPLPNLDILLDTVPLLLYNYLAFACESPLFVYY